jgi:16S rRNA (cytosine1402-N4)-methyltransferase
MSQDREYHRPVMAEEVVGFLRPIEQGVVVDATFGGGGHSAIIKRELGRNVSIVGIDRDPTAAANAAALGVDLLAGDFGDLEHLLDAAGIGEIAGALFDFGVSSHQLDVAERGFSYRLDGPLDMRMDPTQSLSADEVVNRWDAKQLAQAIRRFGEDPNADRIARAIVAARPISGTVELATVIAESLPAAVRRQPGHPARRTFQAIRIVVNDELGSVERGLDAAIDRLAPGGRVIAISYHSLEDRIVKRRFVTGAQGCQCPPGLPVCACGASPELILVTRKPVEPSAAEIEANPRARSARMRVAQKAVA